MSKTSGRNRVSFYCGPYSIGGTERVVCSLSREFRRRDWHVRTVFPAGAVGSGLVQWGADQGVPIEAQPAFFSHTGAKYRSRDLIAMRNLVREDRPDVVNLHYGDNFISIKDVVAVRLAGSHRCIATVHHPTPWGADNVQKRRMTRLSAMLCHQILTVSNATRAVLLEAGIPSRKIQVIPCGLPVPRSHPTPTEARARLGLPPGAFVVGGLARLVPHKGIADLIDAAARVPDPQGRLLIAIAGDGPERAALEGLAASRLKDRVVFLGRVPDVEDFYAACDVFALPSHLEGFGLVYVEAAFHGVPSIGTNVGGVPDAIADGETGLLVPVGDTEALAGAIQLLRDDAALRQKMGGAAKVRAEAMFTERVMADQYQEVFEGC